MKISFASRTSPSVRAAARASRSSSSARAVISWTLSTERIWPGIFFSMLWHWSSISATSLPGPKPPPRIDLDHDPEQLVRVGRADDQVVVGVEPAVEVERAQPAQAQQLRDDELDVRPRRVVPGVEAHERLRPQSRHVGVRGAPVRDVGVVERRLEELVLQHHPLVVTQPVVDRPQPLGQPVLPVADVALPRVVGAVGEPDLQVARARLVHDVDAREVVVHRLAPDRAGRCGSGCPACSRRPGTCSS